MYRICTLVGTRPELIKLSRIIPQMDKSFEHILVHSGQNYDYSLNKIFFNDLKIRKPDYFLNVKSDKLSKFWLSWSCTSSATVAFANFANFAKSALLLL